MGCGARSCESDRAIFLAAGVLRRPGPKVLPPDVNQFTRARVEAMFCSGNGYCRGRHMNYDGFHIKAFEAGTGLWHARIRRADFKPVIIDGVSFPELEVGFAWSNAAAAIADAKTRIDYLNQRCVNAEPTRKAANA